MKAKKRRGSVFHGIIISFAIVLVLGVAIFALLSYSMNMWDIKRSASTHANISSSVVLDHLMNYLGDPQQVELLERDMSDMCENYGFEAMLVVKLDRKNDLHMIANAVGTDPYHSKIWNSNPSDQQSYGQVVKQLSMEDDMAQLWRMSKSNENYYIWQHQIEMNLYMATGDRYYITSVFAADKINEEIISETISFTLPFVALLVLMLVFLLIFLQRNTIKPIKRIAGKMNSFADDYARGDAHVQVAHNNEIGEIACAFNKMSDDITVMIRDIDTMQQERMNASVQLGIAKSIQRGIVPDRTVIKRADLELCAMIQPAKEVAGDFYDVFFRDDGKLCAVVGDVSGKGVSAAFFMMMVKSEIKTRLNMGLTPSEALNGVNCELCAHNPEGMFATVFASVYDPKERSVCFCNAGHIPPMITGDNVRSIQVNNGIALGLFDDPVLVDEYITLQDGEGLIVYTDGVTDAVNEKGEWFGLDRMRSELNGTSEQMIDRIDRRVTEHYNGSERFDDMTLLAITLNASGNVLKPTMESLDDIQSILMKQFNGKMPRRIMLACEEAFANIVSYSGADEISLAVTRKNGNVIAEFSDNGIPFDPVNTRLKPKSVDDFDTGGMGLIIMRRTAKHMHYERRDGINVLSMTFETEEHEQ